MHSIQIAGLVPLSVHPGVRIQLKLPFSFRLDRKSWGLASVRSVHAIRVWDPIGAKISTNSALSGVSLPQVSLTHIHVIEE